MMPKVTVITPNYNYARYLPRRLDSILAQTFRDFELIILDNASTDDSRRVIESYLHDPRVRAVFNERNNGSVFKQWNLGLRQATGEYVWIAESDDYAEPTLLETLVDRLDRHPNVGLAMCQSWIIDEEGRTYSNFPDLLRFAYHDLVGDLSFWGEEFVADGREFCLKHLYKCNEIVNASAVLFRRSVLDAVAGAPEDMRLSGDHMTYVKILMRSDFASVPAYLNYFRTHPATSRARTPREQAVRELRAIQRRINDHFGLGERDRYYREGLPTTIWGMITEERRPPRNVVPLRKSPGLLRRFARLGPRGFCLGLRLLCREQAGATARRLGISRLLRALAGRSVAPAEDQTWPDA